LDTRVDNWKKTLKILVEKVSKPAKTRVLALFGQFLGSIFRKIPESGPLACSKLRFDPQNRLKSVDLGSLPQLAVTFEISGLTSGENRARKGSWRGPWGPESHFLA